MASTPESSDVLLNTLADGFTALLEEAKVLSRRENELRLRLTFAYNEVRFV